MVALDNPIWSALGTSQAHLAIDGGAARRFPAEMGPFVAIETAGREAVAAMGRLAAPGEVLNLVGLVPDAPDGWAVEVDAAVAQMVCERRADVDPDDGEVIALGVADVPAMLALTSLVYPGYFRRRTIEMGAYLGVRREGELVAMAGHRLCLDGHREISGVCTHPASRGQGLASRLVARLAGAIFDEGRTPFLHVDAGNAGARAAYEKLGFVARRDLRLLRVRRVGPGGRAIASMAPPARLEGPGLAGRIGQGSATIGQPRGGARPYHAADGPGAGTGLSPDRPPRDPR